MRTTSDSHGYQLSIELVGAESYLWNKGKVYKSKKKLQDLIGKITCDLDDGKLYIPEFSHCKIVEWFA